MKKFQVFGIVIITATLVILFFLSFGNRKILSQTSNPSEAIKGVPSHTVIYLAKQYMNGVLKSERVISRSVNERGEWYEETLYPQKNKGPAILEDGHYIIDQKSGDKVKYNSATAMRDCTGWADKMKTHSKETVQILGLTAYVVGGNEVGDHGLSYERAYAQETGCTPLRVRAKSNDGFEITYEALQIIFSVDVNQRKNMPVTKDLSKD